ncbi:MAG: acyltransferase [Lachnospiraceae bacterium]|nr:acyltransferase [Lachnospiraceae bacterium]
MIYAVYPLLLIALLWGAKLSKKGEWNDEAFSLRQMKALQGFIAICIMLHHCGQNTSASWIDKRYYYPGLDFFVPMGFVFVSFFTFATGYGLYKSLKTKENYLQNHFIRHRILPIILIGYAVSLIFLIPRYFLGENLRGMRVVWYLTGLKLCNPNGWYVVAIPFFYLCFYLAFRFCKKERTALAIVILFTTVYQLIGVFLDHNDWWMCGEWWYNSVDPFAVGILFAMYEEQIVAHVKRNYVKYLIFGLIAMVAFDILRTYATGVFSYYGEYWDAPDKVWRRIVCLITEELYAASVVFYVFLIGLKLKIGNRFLAFMGTVTLEFYLIHGLYAELFAFSFADELKPLYYIKNNALYVVVVFIFGLLSAIILKKIEDAVKKALRR